MTNDFQRPKYRSTTTVGDLLVMDCVVFTFLKT